MDRRRLRACQEAFVARQLARNEANRRVRLIRQCFRWAASEEMIPPSMLQGLDTLVGLKKNRTTAPDRAPIRPIADAIVQATLPHLPRAVRATVEIQRLTGMRPTEVAIMRTVDLNTTGTIWEYGPSSHKLDHLDVERIVMIGPRAQEISKHWFRTDIEAYLFSPAETLEEFHAERPERRKTPMTPSQKSRERRRKSRAPRDHYDVTGYRRSIHRTCDDAFPHPELSEIRKKDLTAEQGAELSKWQASHRWSPNRLRLAAATLVRREMGINAARACLGHSAADTTTIYAERDKELARVAMERLG